MALGDGAQELPIKKELLKVIRKEVGDTMEDQLEQRVETRQF